ncbi:hypothetical protein ACLBXO_16795 [Methylobacterium sp. C33D]|uniref:hypothetical protein n=1 Tax=Methylobacterium mesophilicum TaxID=39956 RepID=UPI002F358EFE
MSIVADIVFFLVIDAIEAAWRFGRRRLFGAAPDARDRPGSETRGASEGRSPHAR